MITIKPLFKCICHLEELMNVFELLKKESVKKPVENNLDYNFILLSVGNCIGSPEICDIPDLIAHQCSFASRAERRHLNSKRRPSATLMFIDRRRPSWVLAIFFGGAVIDIEATSTATRSAATQMPLRSEPVLSGGSRVNYFGTVRGSLGYAFGPALVYGTGGFAYAGTTSSVTADSYGSLSATRTHMGYAFGGGVEYAVAENITLRTEFIRAVFDSRQLAAASDGYGDGAQLTHTPSINVVRAGVNFRIPTLGQCRHQRSST